MVQRFPGYGGAEEYVLQLIQRLAGNGIACTIYTSNLDERSVWNLPKSVRVVKFPVVFQVGEYAVWNGLLKELLTSHVDIFHVNTYGYFHTDLVSLVHRIKNMKVVLTSHGFHGLDMYFNSFKSNVGKKSKVSFLSKCRYLSRPFYDLTLGLNEVNSADALVALSEKDVEIYRWMGAEESKIHDIPQGVRDVFFESPDKVAVAKLREQINGDPVILSVGELSCAKAKDTALRAMALLVKECPRAKLVFVGKDGGTYGLLKNLAVHLGIEENVLFVGYVSSDQLINYYHVADVLVHTSLAEGLSTIILEALAAGVPIVSTPAGGNAYLLKKSNAGIVVPFNDPNSVYLAVSKIMGGKPFKKSLSANGSDYALRNFQWDKIAKKYQSLYETL